MLASVVGAASVAGVAATASAVSATEKPALIVLDCPGSLHMATIAFLRESMEAALKDTPFDGVKVLVLSEGMKLRFIDKAGADLLPGEVVEA
jgi:hypothetical protein